MINRRQVLIGITTATVGLTSSSSALAAFLRPGVEDTPNATTEIQPLKTKDEAVDDQLRKDLSKLDSRANSEEGVPVFLACVNLVRKAGSQNSPRVALTTLNTTVAEEFRRDAAAWQRIRPGSSARDVGLLIEVLAERDFSKGVEEQKW